MCNFAKILKGNIVEKTFVEIFFQLFRLEESGAETWNHAIFTEVDDFK